MRAQVPPLAVHRHQVARLGHVEQRAQLAGRRVPGDVHHRRLLVDDRGAEPGQAVDDLVDGGLVARHQRGRQHDRVAGLDGDLVVLAAGHAAERRQRLPLRAGADQHDLLGRHRRRLVQARPSARGRRAAGRGRGRRPCCGPSSGRPARTLRPCTVGGVEHLLDAVHVAGEAGDDQPLGGPAEDVLEHRADRPLGGDEARHLGVGGVGQQQVDALQAEPGERSRGR